MPAPFVSDLRRSYVAKEFKSISIDRILEEQCLYTLQRRNIDDNHHPCVLTNPKERKKMKEKMEKKR